MGPSHSTGVSHPFQGGASPNVPSPTLPVLGGANETVERGSGLLAGEGSSGDSGPDCIRGGFLLNSLSSAQDRRLNEASHKPKALNFWVQPQHFKMEGIHTLREIVAEGNWLAKLDFKDACFTVPVLRDHQRYLRFVVHGIRYQFTCLLFGLSCAPWAFT